MSNIASNYQINIACSNVKSILMLVGDIDVKIKEEIISNYNKKYSYEVNETKYLEYLLHFSIEAQTLFKKFGPVIYTPMNDTDLNERMKIYSIDKKVSRWNIKLDQIKLNPLVL